MREKDNSLRLVPASDSKSASVQDTSNSFGLHDTLAHGPRSLAAEVQTVSPIKDRLENVRTPVRVENLASTNGKTVGGDPRQLEA